MSRPALASGPMLWRLNQLGLLALSPEGVERFALLGAEAVALPIPAGVASSLLADAVERGEFTPRERS